MAVEWLKRFQIQSEYAFATSSEQMYTNDSLTNPYSK